MSKHMDRNIKVNCRKARQNFAALGKARLAGSGPARQSDPGNAELESINRHVQSCSRCAQKYRLHSLRRAILDAAAAPGPFSPDENFFLALRARIARGPEQPAQQAGTLFEDSWSGVVLMTARQLLPVMAMLLLLIIGATLIWGRPHSGNETMAVRPSERVMFNDLYEYPGPTPDDVLETLVAVEEKENGK